MLSLLPRPLLRRFVLLCCLAVMVGQRGWSDETSSNIRRGPMPIQAGDFGVGKMIPDVEMTDIDGATHRLSDFADRKAMVFAMTGTGCPLCQKYTPTLANIEQEYREAGVQFLYINPNASEDLDRIRTSIADNGIESPYIVDRDKTIVRGLAAKTTTEVFVVDASRTLVYRGAVDDQYGFGYSLDEPRETYLKDALDDFLAGRPARVRSTSSPGCKLFYEQSQPAIETPVTYHQQVSRIVDRHCIECHREDAVAPISLESYEQVRDYAEMIRDVVDRGVMPPWFAATGSSHSPAEGTSAQHWANERVLSASEKADLFAWIDSDAPEGDPADAPVRRAFPEGWLIGEPDAIYEFPSPVPVKATGTMPYENIVVDTGLTEGKWVQAIEVQPGQRSVVHHVIVTVLSGDSASVGSDGRHQQSGYWGVYVPGNSTLDYPEGYAKWLPAGAKLNFQMHYTPNGTATEDSSRIGLIFAERPPRHEVKVVGILNSNFRIPAGASNYPVTKEIKVSERVEVLGFLPHMHLRGKAARYELVRGGIVETLLDVPQYDFNWQLRYELSRPRTMDRGDSVRYTAWYDNSSDNPANPDPTRNVPWGDQTEDEMHLGFVEYVTVGEIAGAGEQSPMKQRALFKLLDVDRDGLITRDEVRTQLPGNRAAATTTFDRLDRNYDDQVDPVELSRL